jgi:hypothetical protein
MIVDVVAGAVLSLAVIGSGLWYRSQAGGGFERRLGTGLVVLGVLANPAFSVLAGDIAAVHAVLAVGVLAIPLFLFWNELTQTHDPLARLGRLTAITVPWVWGFAVLNDLVVFGEFEGFWQRAWHTDAAVGTVTLMVQGITGFLVMSVLMGDGRPALTHVRQVVVAWTSAMLIMGVGIAMGLAPGTWYGYLVHSEGYLGAMTDQQIAAAVLLLGGGAVWFILGAQKMKLWLDAEERDGRRGGLSRGLRIGRSVRRP